MTEREKWLQKRLNGIGASEAAAIVGLNPYISNVLLWEYKTKRKQAPDISSKACVEYGNRAEEHLRNLFMLDFPQYEVSYDEFGIVANDPEYPFIFATLDGDLTERETGRKGILEIKTTEILNPSQWGKWDNCLPDNYFVQVLHQLIATGYDFAMLKAQIKYQKKGEMCLTTRHYLIERADVLEDIKFLKEKEKTFWQEYVLGDKEPPLLLPEI